MKTIFTTLLTVLLFAPGNSMVRLCPEGQDDGEGCYYVDEVYFFGDWHFACCEILLHIPPGMHCAWDNCNASQNPPAEIGFERPYLDHTNSYMYYAQGYRTWLLIETDKGYITKNAIEAEIGMEEIRKYLPISRSLFKKNKTLERISYVLTSDINVIVERPQNEADLEAEIVFPNTESPSSQEMKNYKYRLDDNGLTFFPNPVIDNVRVFFNNGILLKSAKVYTLDGKMVHQFVYDNPDATLILDMSELEDAIYLVKITDKYNRRFSRQIVKTSSP